MVKTSIGAALTLSLTIGLLATPAAARDQQCSVLEAMGAKYAGVKLTPEQEVLKVKFTAWYVANCRGHQVAGAAPAATLSSIR